MLPVVHVHPVVVADDAPAVTVPVAIIMVVVVPELTLFPLLRLALVAGVELVTFPVHSQFGGLNRKETNKFNDFLYCIVCICRSLRYTWLMNKSIRIFFSFSKKKTDKVGRNIRGFVYENLSAANTHFLVDLSKNYDNSK